jgi:hypothetical protein
VFSYILKLVRISEYFSDSVFLMVIDRSCAARAYVHKHPEKYISSKSVLFYTHSNLLLSEH